MASATDPYRTLVGRLTPLIALQDDLLRRTSSTLISDHPKYLLVGYRDVAAHPSSGGGPPLGRVLCARPLARSFNRVEVDRSSYKKALEDEDGAFVRAVGQGVMSRGDCFEVR
jgi:hypothetical protein